VSSRWQARLARFVGTSAGWTVVTRRRRFLPNTPARPPQVACSSNGSAQAKKSAAAKLKRPGLRRTRVFFFVSSFLCLLSVAFVWSRPSIPPSDHHLGQVLLPAPIITRGWGIGK
jgi:hypothetical protein